MGLSRLDNFLKSVRGTILYVDPNSIDSTDAFDNQGNSLTRPFKTIQRALIEASRFSYQRGLDNDRFGRTTILLYPGDHLVDNRPGWIPDGANNFILRSSIQSTDFPAWDSTTNYDLTTNDNALYKLNSIHGGVIVPRGTSIVGLDLRKTKIRPKYVPDPENDQIERSAVFRVTAGSYFWQFSAFDADPNDVCYKDYTSNTFVPNFSHHKLTVFEYADGVNNVSINDDFINFTADKTDLDFYYAKVGLAYGTSSGRNVEPDYPSNAIDIETKVDEFRIVGSKGQEVGITSIKAGDGVNSSTLITATLSEDATAFDVDTPIRIEGVGESGYDGQFVVASKLDSTTIQYNVQNAPLNALPTIAGATINISVDTVTSASPYVFNCSVRSVYGMCGLHADGSKASGFKSMIVAQYTGIGLQKDPKAFVIYNPTTGLYEDSTASGNENIQTNSRARYKPSYATSHIKTSNDGYIQIVSVFGIGYSAHFLSESGGDQSITNSNSNFGSVALRSSGFKKDAFPKDDVGYITHVVAPKENEDAEVSIEYYAIDVDKTVSVGATSKLYLYGQTNASVAPDSIIDGYRIGAKAGDTLNVLISQSGISTEYTAEIVMPGTELSSQKKFVVGRSSVGINSISSDVITFTENHNFVNGESIRVISETGTLPDGITNNTIYHAITSGTGISGSNQIKIAQTQKDAAIDNSITINNGGSVLSVISRVSDKKAGDIGHPVQYDNQWYVSAPESNALFDIINSLGVAGLGAASPRTYIKRKPDNRSLNDTIYRLRYVIPADSTVTASPPTEGFIIQDSNVSIGSTLEAASLYSPSFTTLSNSTQLRNPRFIADASWNSGTANYRTEIPHGLSVGAEVEIFNITSTNNTAGIANSAYNGTFTVSGISSSKHFSFDITNDPGTFSNNTSIRTPDLPFFKKKKTSGTYYVYKSEEIQNYISGKQDGIYHLTVLNSSNAPSIAPFTSTKFSQPVQNLYPQKNRDNPVSNPEAATSSALPDIIGQVVVNDPQKSITRETLNKSLLDNGVGVGLTNITSFSNGKDHILYTDIDHGFDGITGVTVGSPGFNYADGNYYNVSLVGFAGSTTGSQATARVTVSGGTLSSIKIIDGGSAYGIGNTLALIGVGTASPHVPGYVIVDKINSSAGDAVSVDGITKEEFKSYNTSYKISSVTNSKEILVSSASTISVAGLGYTAGIGMTSLANASAVPLGKTLDVHSFAYDNITGIATVLTNLNHGLKLNSNVRLSGTDDIFFEKDYIVKSVGTTTSFTVNADVSTGARSTSGNITVFPVKYSSSGGNIVISDEDSSGRLIAQYAGITTTTTSSIGVLDNTVAFNNLADLNLNIGDYLLVDSELMRINATVSTGTVSVFRGVLGTKTISHVSGSVVRRVHPRPIELRRNSAIRASGHTFEYTGFGPGNYSTALPQKQDRNLTPQEEILSQATKSEGGLVSLTGMNDRGDFYIGNKKVNPTTGSEIVFDTPIPTVTGEDVIPGEVIGFDLQTSSESTITRSIRVEGGSDSTAISQFDGPVIFNGKVVSNSNKGIEANSLYLQGDTNVSRKYTVGIATPILAGNPGDVHYNALPAGGEYVGWVYTNNNRWEQFGYIGNPVTPSGVGIYSGSNYVGFSSNIDFISGIGATIRTVFDSTVGITTVTFDSEPLRVGISTGLGAEKVFAGIATEINFIGYGISITAVQNATGIASITFDGSASGGGGGAPGLPVNSLQFNKNGFFTGNAGLTYDETNLYVQNSIGINTGSPTAKLEIVHGSTEGLRIQNNTEDPNPIVVDASGNLGVSTVTPIAPLDVMGDAAVSGELKIYDPNRDWYVGLNATTGMSNHARLTLPTTVGGANSIFYSTGNGVLDWISPAGVAGLAYTNTDGLSEGSANIYFTDERAQDAIGAAIAAGIQTGITVTYDDANDRINYFVSAQVYPFTTKGFSMPL